jgi:hypothetical protein
MTRYRLDRSRLANQLDIAEFYGQSVWLHCQECQQKSAANAAQQQSRIAELEQILVNRDRNLDVDDRSAGIINVPKVTVFDSPPEPRAAAGLPSSASGDVGPPADD